jgi:hypothetical protein
MFLLVAIVAALCRFSSGYLTSSGTTQLINESFPRVADTVENEHNTLRV